MFCDVGEVVFLSRWQVLASLPVTKRHLFLEFFFFFKKKLPFFGKLIPVSGFTERGSAFSKANIVIIDTLGLPRFC